MKRTHALLSILGLSLAGALLLVWGSQNPAPQVSSARSTSATRAQEINPAGISGQARLAESYGKLPLTFEANQGQTDSQVKFLSRGRGYALFLTGNDAVLSLRSQKRPVAQHSSLNAATYLPKTKTVDQSSQFAGLPALLEKPQSLRADAALREETPAADVLRLKLVGANSKSKVVGIDELPGKSNYFIGNDPKKWRTNVPNYAKVRYQDVYPGVDLVYYGNQRQLEYDFIVAPGADPNAISLTIENRNQKFETRQPSIENRQSKIHIDASGDLVIGTGSSEVRFHKPVVYQHPWPVASGNLQGTTDDERRTMGIFNRQSSISNRQFLDGRYVLATDNRIRFEISTYDKTRPLVIDPVLAYSTYLGGSNDDYGNAIAVDSSGNAYVTGQTLSTDFPTVNALQATCASCSSGLIDAFVAKLNSAGSALVYSTYLGGSGVDGANGIAVDSSGNAYVTGSTNSTDFPIANSSPFNPGGCVGGAFVSKLTAPGNALTYSTYLGCGSAKGIAVDSSGRAYVTGFTNSADFPTMNPIQAANAGASDAFVTKLNAAGSALVYSSYLGGTGGDVAFGIAVDSSGNAYVTGYTLSTDFPTVNALQATCASCVPSVATNGNVYPDAFVTKLNAAGSALVYSTYLGGSASDVGFGIAVDSLGNAYVTGSSNCPALNDPGFPTVNPLQATCGPGAVVNAFVTKLNAAGSALAYSTYLGGNYYDVGMGIALDSSGSAYVMGQTGSTDFPTMNPIQATNAGHLDAFISKISPPVALSPQSLNFSGQIMGTTSNSGTVRLNNLSGATLTISSISASGDFAVASGTTCSASSPVPAGSTCQINVTFTPTASGSRTGALTVADSDPTSPQTVALAGIGEDFGVAVASGGSSSMTVTAGGTATYTISVSPLGGFNQAVAMTCGGAPSLSTCMPSVPSVTLDGTNAQNVTFTVTTTSSTLSAQRVRSFPPFAFSLFFMPLLAFAIVGARRRALIRPAFLVFALALASLTYLAACSGRGSAATHNPGTPAGAYALTISGTSGSLGHSTQVTLKVQ
jgi:hypothetical protein